MLRNLQEDNPFFKIPQINHIVGSLAQSVEQRTFNPLVEGSNPSRPTTSPLEKLYILTGR